VAPRFSKAAPPRVSCRSRTTRLSRS
jgi:hypothetical protein